MNTYIYIYLYINSDWGMFINPMFIVFFYPWKNPIHDEHETYTVPSNLVMAHGGRGELFRAMGIHAPKKRGALRSQ
jgi:hypothetical protein